MTSDASSSPPLAAVKPADNPANNPEWRRMSDEWRGALTKLLNTLDSVNKNREEVERQKELIRHALTQGRFDIIQRERAMAFYNDWNRGMQMVPLYPEDYLPNTDDKESVFLSTMS